MEYRWEYTPTPNAATQKKLQKDLNISPILAQILAQRGVSTYEEARAFFRPHLQNLHSPWLMQDMEPAVTRINSARQQQQKIMVYGDYDVDGTTSVALMAAFLKKHYPHFITYIPDRYREGYGVSKAGIEQAAEEGCSLIIALDCGIKAQEAVAYAQKLGIDFIICDHHLPGDDLPKAVAVLDPKREDCQYPFKELSGCGVGFKLVQALCENWQLPAGEWTCLLDLLAVSIGADIVPIVGENRILAYHGLQKLNTDPRPGLALLMELSARKVAEWTINDVVFQIGPRINAAGRLAHGKLAVELLISPEAETREKLAGVVDEHNQNRRTLDKNITQEALRQIQQEDHADRSTTVVRSAAWHKGVVGIVASRLTENYYRPTIVFTERENTLTGSARSVKGFNIYEALLECKEHLSQFGGHAFAAGMSLPKENYDAFKEQFEKVVAQRIDPSLLQPSIDVDAELPWEEINGKFYRILKQLEPFGPQNLNPVFVTPGLLDTGRSRAVGNDGKHLRVQLRCPHSNLLMEGIGFGLQPKLELLQSGKPVSVAYHLEMNTFRDKQNLELRVLDIKIGE